MWNVPKCFVSSLLYFGKVLQNFFVTFAEDLMFYDQKIERFDKIPFWRFNSVPPLPLEIPDHLPYI